MPLNAELVGKTYPAPETFEVGREHIRSFALAIGEADPIHLDPKAAKAAGYADVVAPPTFLTTLSFRFAAYGPVIDPDLGLNYAMVVHGEQKFAHARPVVAGDRLKATSTITEIRSAGRNEYLTVMTDVTDEKDGTPVSSLTQVIVSRGTAAE